MPKADDDIDPSETNSDRRIVWPILLVSVVALATFLLSLIASMPGRIAGEYAEPPVDIKGYSGTLWNGMANLDGDNAVAWKLEPWRSLISLRPRFAVTVSGPGSDAVGQVSLSGPLGGRLAVDGLNGRIAWSFIAALAPTAVRCDATLIMRSISLDMSRPRVAAGELRTTPATCVDAEGEAVILPPLVGSIAQDAAGPRLDVTRGDAPDGVLGEVILTNDDTVALTLRPQGAALIPGLPVSGDITVEYPLSALGL